MQSVFITGASSGIGLAAVREMQWRGWQVFAGYLPGENLDALKSGASERLTLVPIDITQDADIAAARQMVAQAVGSGGLHGLVNNAGIGLSCPMEALPIAALRQVLEVNFFGHVAVTQAFLPLVRRTSGRIVNTASILGRVVTPFSGAYCASKFALEAFTDALRLELQPWNIHVAAIEPGIIRTPIWQKTIAHLDEFAAELPPEAEQHYGQRYRAVRQSIIAITARAIPAEQAAAAIAHALTAPRPRTRYLVGSEARFAAFARWLLPDRLFDALIRRRYNL